MNRKKEEDILRMDKKRKELATLITAIDWSGSKEFPKDIYILVSVEDRDFSKLAQYLSRKLKIRHWKELSKREKTIYTGKFLRKWEEIKKILKVSDVKFNLDDLLLSNQDIIRNSKVVVLDDSLTLEFQKVYSEKRIIKESRSKEYRLLINLADNIANIIRRLAKDKKKLFEAISLFIKRS